MMARDRVLALGAAGRDFHNFKVCFLRNQARETYNKYPAIPPPLPAMGHSPQQVKALEDTIKASACELVVVATPIDLRRAARLDKPCDRVRYELQEIGHPTLADLLSERFD